MHMHALKCQYHKNMFGIISTPKVPASFPFQVQRSHTLSNWDAIQDAPCTWTKRICSLRSSAKTRKKSRQRKKQIQKIALVAMSTWTGMTYHPCRTRSKACSMKCFEEFRCCWATIRIFYSESIMKVFRRIFNACFGVKHCLLHRALPVARWDLRARC